MRSYSKQPCAKLSHTSATESAVARQTLPSPLGAGSVPRFSFNTEGARHEEYFACLSQGDQAQSEPSGTFGSCSCSSLEPASGCDHALMQRKPGAARPPRLRRPRSTRVPQNGKDRGPLELCRTDSTMTRMCKRNAFTCERKVFRKGYF